MDSLEKMKAQGLVDIKNFTCTRTAIKSQFLVSEILAGSHASEKLVLADFQYRQGLALEEIIGGHYSGGAYGSSESDMSFWDAIEICEPLAKSGNSAAHNLLGLCYEHKGNIFASYIELLRYFRMSAVLGNPDGQYNYSRKLFEFRENREHILKMDGLELRDDNDYFFRKNGSDLLHEAEEFYKGNDALEWLEKSAKGGNIQGMTHLGILYLYGLEGLSKDEVRGLGLLLEASHKGNRVAQAHCDRFDALVKFKFYSLPKKPNSIEDMR